MNTQTKILIAITVAVLFGIVIYAVDANEKARLESVAIETRPRTPAEVARRDTPIPTDDDTLPAAAGCVGDRIVVENRSTEVWEGARIEVNGVWKYSPDTIVPGRQPYIPALFTKSDGTRLTLSAVTCKTIDIHATMRGKRLHWNGAY